MNEQEITAGLQGGNTQALDRVPEQLRPYLWQKGKSGNPAGRRRGQVSLKAALVRRLRDNPAELRLIVEGLINRAVGGDVPATKLISELLGELGAGLNVGVVVGQQAPAIELSRAEIDAILLERFYDIRLAESGAVPALPVPAGQEPAQASAGAGEPAGAAIEPDNSE